MEEVERFLKKSGNNDKRGKIYIVLKIALWPVEGANWGPMSPESSVRKLFDQF